MILKCADLFWLQKEEKNHRYNGFVSPYAIRMDLVRNVIEHRHIINVAESTDFSYNQLTDVIIHTLSVVRHMLMSLIGLVYIDENDPLIKTNEFGPY